MCRSISCGGGVKGKKTKEGCWVLAWLADWMMIPFTDLGTLKAGQAFMEKGERMGRKATISFSVF